MGGKRLALFLDANILFSAAHDPESRSAALFTLAKQRPAVTLMTSAYATEEARRNLALKRPENLPTLKELLSRVRTVREAPIETVREAAVRHGIPAPDAPILAAALEARADILVTGDVTHFGHLMDRRQAGLPIRVLRLRNTLRLLL